MWPDSDTTQQILERVQQGDAEAAGKLLERHRASLYRLIEMRLDRRIRRRVDASDIVQEVMVEANRRLALYLQDPSLPFHLWLRQMARDRIIDAHRRHRASHKRSVDREQPHLAPGTLDHSTLNLIAQLQDPQLTPAAAATMHELERRVAVAVEQLDERDREIILMRHAEQLSNQEVALALGLTEPAASMRYLRAVRRLRACLARQNGSGEDTQ
jgi:RNA polymerase sigma-70 factor (ECF subfamily)